jgi:hypothetical protein
MVNSSRNNPVSLHISRSSEGLFCPGSLPRSFRDFCRQDGSLIRAWIISHFARRFLPCKSQGLEIIGLRGQGLTRMGLPALCSPGSGSLLQNFSHRRLVRLRGAQEFPLRAARFWVAPGPGRESPRICTPKEGMKIRVWEDKKQGFPD